MKKALSLVLALLMCLALLTACGGSGNDTPSSGSGSGSSGDSGVPSYASLKVGEDYTDVTWRRSPGTSAPPPTRSSAKTASWRSGP